MPKKPSPGAPCAFLLCKSSAQPPFPNASRAAAASPRLAREAPAAESAGTARATAAAIAIVRLAGRNIERSSSALAQRDRRRLGACGAPAYGGGRPVGG